MSSNPIRVLLVDDDEEMLVLMRHLLKCFPSAFDVQRAPTEHAYRTLSGDEIDVCLVRHRPDDASGNALREFLRRARETGCTAPIIVLTSHTHADIDMHAMSAGASDCLTQEELNPRLVERSIRYAIERNRIQGALHHSEERVHRILTSVPVLLFELNREGLVTFVDGAVLDVMGLRASDLVGRSAFDMYPDMASATRRALAGQPFTVTVKINEVVLEAHVAPMRDAPGRVIGAVGVARDITARSLAEKALRDSQHLFQTFMDHSNAITFIKDLDLQYVFVNKQFADQLQRPADEIVGCTDHDLFDRDRAAMWEETDRMAIRSGNSVTRIDKVSGDRHFLTTKFLLNDAAGHVLIGGQSIEITERVRTELLLRKSEERFQLAARATNDAIWDWDLATNTLWWNSNVHELFRYDTGSVDVTLEWWGERLHPEDHDRVIASVTAAIGNNEQFWSGEYRFLCGDGTYAHVLDRGYVMRDLNGAPIRMIGAMTDNTQRKLAEEALRASEERYRRIVETAQEGIVILDAQGVVTFANARMVELLGSTTVQLVQRPLQSYLHPEEQHTAQLLLRARKDREAFRGDTRLVCNDGSVVWVRISTSPLLEHDDSLTGTLAMLSDISARKEAEQALQEAHDQLEMRVAERTAEIVDMMARLEQAHLIQKRFVADASHDLRTPLTVVRAELDLLLERAEHDSGTRASLVRIADESKRLENMASNLLLLATIDAQQSILLGDAVQLDDLLFDCVTQLQVVSRDKDIAWNIDVHEPITLRCNASMLRRALTNVLENAVKYSPASTLIDVTLAPVENGAHITINDYGPGIPEKDLPRVFDRFYRGDHTRNTSGTGLGLAIVKAVVEGHGGRVTIDSQSGRGTTVRIGLPLDPAD